jgi:hypothetical protein
MLFQSSEEKTLMSHIIGSYLKAGNDVDKLILECVRNYYLIGFNIFYTEFRSAIIGYLSGRVLDIAEKKKYMSSIIDGMSENFAAEDIAFLRNVTEVLSS